MAGETSANKGYYMSAHIFVNCFSR